MALVHGSIEKMYEIPERPAGGTAGGAEPPDDLYLRSPEPEGTDSSPELRRADEVTWRSGEPRAPELLYDPLEEPELGEPAAPPDPADGSTLLFRLALSTAALLVLLVLARGFWWPETKTRESAPAPAAAPRSTPAPPPAVPKPQPPETPAIEEPVIEEEETPAIEEEPEPRKPEPAAVAEAPPEPALTAPVRPRPAAPAAPSREAAPTAEPEGAAIPASPRRLSQPWEEGPQPPDLLKPGPGVQEPVPLDFPPYSYPAAAHGTGLQVDVRLAVLVDERGRVIEARVREGAPPDLGFSETALAAARRISFQPATRYDVPGKMWTEVILEFVE